MNKYVQLRTSLSFVHNASRQHIIGLYGTPVYIYGRFDSRFDSNEKTTIRRSL